MDAGRHGLEPEPLDGLFGLGVLDDVAENQFAFAAGVAGIDQAVHVLALDQAQQELEAVLGLFDGLQIKMLRDDRQMGKSPLAAFDLDAFRQAKFQQMADGGGKDIAVALEVVACFGEAAERLGDVRRDRRLFRND